MKKIKVCLILILIISTFISNLSYAKIAFPEIFESAADYTTYGPTSDEVKRDNTHANRTTTNNNTNTSASTGPVSESDGTLSGVGLTGEGNGIDPNLNAKTGRIIGAIQMIGYFFAVGIIIFVGIKYIMASGDEKADLKTAIPKYCMGALLIALCDTVTVFIFNTLK